MTRGHASNRAAAGAQTTRVNKVALATVLVLALAAAGSAEPNQQQSDAAIARPSSRAATAFVPRLGKRFDRSNVGALERLLCADPQDCGRLALLGALVRGMASGQEGRGATAPFAPDQALDGIYAPLWTGRQAASQEQELVGEDNSPSLLELIIAQQQRAQSILPRRDTRGEVPMLGAKRVVHAFTPRIGR